MIQKLALKRLTASDLTFFAWQFKNQPAGNQKAINLNAAVLTGELYPALDSLVLERQKRIGVDLWVAGPDGAAPINLQRKIIKGAAYKNWRLDGELVHNPEGEPGRFNSVRPGDIGLFAFAGELIPDIVILLLVSQDAPHDFELHRGLNETLGTSGMVVFDEASLGLLCRRLGVPESHSVWMIVRDEDLAEASLGLAPAIDRLATKPRFANLTYEDLKSARQQAEEIGRLGEEFVEMYLNGELENGSISDFEWTSKSSPLAPYDFRVKVDGSWRKWEVKTTTGPFNREYYLSQGELREMANGDGSYCVARVYQATRESGLFRVSRDLRPFGQSIISALSNLPSGVLPNGVTISPDDTVFATEVELTVTTETQE